MTHKDISDLEDIKVLVDRFYERAARDERLGQIFLPVAHADSGTEARYVYWCELLLDEKSIDVHTCPEHIRMMFSRQHFARWLTLFLETIDLLYVGERTERAKVTVIRKSEEFQSCVELSGF